jgi:hypothetical protein
MCQGGTEKAKSIKLKVNGKEVSLNPFSTHIIGSTIWAMVTSLKLDEKPSKVEIELSE